MTIWTISNLERDPATGVVKVAHWRATATEGAHTASVYGSATLPAPPPSATLEPFETLTEEMVLGWVWQWCLDKDETEATLAAQLATLAAPPVVPGVPW